MDSRIGERVAVALTVFGCILVVALPFVYEFWTAARGAPARAVTLTGVADVGIWTEDDVSAGDYWYHGPSRARPLLRPGERILLRLKSADVIHTFYAPALGVGPVEVYPGHVAEVEITAPEEGIFEYYCTTVCGMPHFGMRGEFVIASSEGDLDTREADRNEYWKEPSPDPDSSMLDLGSWLFRQKGCATCHGPEGEGGVSNWNYVDGTVPTLNTLAEKMMLFYPEDAEEIIHALEEGRNLEDLREDPPIPRYNVFLAQYKSVRDVILKGNPPGKKDPEGPDPPLEMLTWGQRLSGREVDALIAYLLSLQPWEE